MGAVLMMVLVLWFTMSTNRLNYEPQVYKQHYACLLSTRNASQSYTVTKHKYTTLFFVWTFPHDP